MGAKKLYSFLSKLKLVEFGICMDMPVQMLPSQVVGCLACTLSPESRLYG